MKRTTATEEPLTADSFPDVVEAKRKWREFGEQKRNLENQLEELLAEESGWSEKHRPGRQRQREVIEGKDSLRLAIADLTDSISRQAEAMSSVTRSHAPEASAGILPQYREAVQRCAAGLEQAMTAAVSIMLLRNALEGENLLDSDVLPDLRHPFLCLHMDPFVENGGVNQLWLSAARAFLERR